jgi:AcrR family transcriptional regulator
MAAVTTVSSAGPTGEAARRAGLLSLAADYVLEGGLSGLSLRPLAAALGTSGRMLVYYFGSKDQLVLDVLAEVRRRKYEDLGLRRNDERALARYWDWARSPEGQRYLRLVYEVYGLSLHEGARFGAFLAEETAEVLDVITEGLRQAGVSGARARMLSTYTFAALRGLELDLLATGDDARVHEAFQAFEADLERRLREAATPRPQQQRRA